jgi:putative ABC transport system permease protein
MNPKVMYEVLVRDFRYGARMLAKRPGFTVLALTALALGIGATTAMYTVMDAVLLRPLRFPESERLMMLWEVQPNSNRTNVIQTQNFLDWRTRNRSFDAIAAMQQTPMNLTGIGEPIQVTGLRVTADFFQVMGVSPLIGRVIAREEDIRGNPGTVVLGYGLFNQRYGGRSDILGQKIVVNGAPLEVVGVMPQDFAFPNIKADLYTPLQLPSSAPNDGRNFRGIGRLRAGVSIASAQAEMKAMAAQTALERPAMNTNWSATAIPLLDQTVGTVRPALRVLFGAVIFLLLIACANVANLLLMKGVSRRREMVVRLAIGAGRGDLLRQMTAESLLLSVIGGILGIAIAQLGLRTILASLPSGFPLPRIEEIHIDGRVLLFTIVVSIVVGMIFGILPAIQARRANLRESLSEGGRGLAHSHRRLGAALVSLEIAVALLLVTGAGLLIRSFEKLTSVETGFNSSGVLTARMLLLPTKYRDPARRAAAVDAMLERIRALPRVMAAGSIHFLPMIGTNSGTWYYRSDRPEPAPERMTGGDVSVISSDYFRSLHIPFLAGRDFDRRDSISSPKVVILNESAARMLFPGENALGKHVAVRWEGQPDAEVIGIVADIRHGGLQYAPDPCVFLPVSQEPHFLVSLTIRTSVDPILLAGSVEEQVRAVDPDQGVSEIKTMDDVISESVASPRLQSILLGTFSFIAMALAAVGIYGIVSFSVVERMREIGVRMAIGAAPRTVARLVLWDGLKMTAAGSVAGVAAAFALTRYLESLLYGVASRDAVVFIAVVLTVFAVSAAACLIPARRAAKVDPATVLRSD